MDWLSFLFMFVLWLVLLVIGLWLTSSEESPDSGNRRYGNTHTGHIVKE